MSLSGPLKDNSSFLDLPLILHIIYTVKITYMVA